MLQKQAASILSELREFFNRYPTNTIEFWEYPSKSNWHLHKAVVSRSLMVDFVFIFSFHFILFFFSFFFSFLFLEQLGLGFICHAVTSVTS